MIKGFIVKNFLEEELELILTEPEKSGIAIQSVTGLGPGKAMLNIKEIASDDGGSFNGARTPVRNIVMNLIFVDEYETIEDVRQKTYRYFPLKRPLTLTVITDNITAEIDGYVESNEPEIFSEREGCQISIQCSKPYFYSKYEQITISSCEEPLFEFPFENPLIENPEDENIGYLVDKSMPDYSFYQDKNKYNLQISEGLIIGNINKYIINHVVDYVGSKSVGFQMEIEFLEDLKEWYISGIGYKYGYIVINSNRYSGKNMIIDLKKVNDIINNKNKSINSINNSDGETGEPPLPDRYGLTKGSSIIIDTRKKKKSIRYQTSSFDSDIKNKQFNILPALDDEEWFEISIGKNIFHISHTTDPTNNNLSSSDLEHVQTYKLEVQIKNEIFYEGV